MSITTLHINFISEEAIYTLALKPNLFTLWSILRHEYRKHKAASRTKGENDILKCYFCHNAWLAEKLGISEKQVERNVSDLSELGFLVSILHTSRAGNDVKTKAYRIPLDPQDADYTVTVNTYRKYIGATAETNPAPQIEEVTDTAPTIPLHVRMNEAHKMIIKKWGKNYAAMNALQKERMFACIKWLKTDEAKQQVENMSTGELFKLMEKRKGG